MKKIIITISLILVSFALTTTTAHAYTKDYLSQTLNDWGKGHFQDVWNLTTCDLTLSYTIDMSSIANAGWAVTEAGLREVGGDDIDPNDVGGWMQSNYISSVPNLSSQNNNDMHMLSKHGWLYQTYDVENPYTLITPYWSGNNYGFWFDRDGVDIWQAALWGASDGNTYNTGGVYDIEIDYHAIDSEIGTMFATINGVPQGLYIGGWKDAQPKFYPAGRSFDGDMTQMQVFYGRGGGGGTVEISDIKVSGCRLSVEPNKVTGGADRIKAGSTYFSLAVNAVHAGKNKDKLTGKIEYSRDTLKFHAETQCVRANQEGTVATIAGPITKEQYDPNNAIKEGDWAYVAIKEGGTGSGDRVRVRIMSPEAAEAACMYPDGETSFPGIVEEGEFKIRL
ncbi:MAG: hypothetical protein ABIA11_04090 [Patescibacteria group bacterium]